MESYFEELRGRLEIVRIRGVISPAAAVGRIAGACGDVVVQYGGKYVGRSVVARFELDTKKWRKYPLAAVINPDVPDDFRPLSPEEYILFGLYESDRLPELKNRGVPRLNDVRNCFDYLSLYKFFYSVEKSDKRGGRVLVTEDGARRVRGTYQRVIQKHLPPPRVSTRLMLSESEHELEKIARAIRDCSLYPMRVAPVC